MAIKHIVDDRKARPMALWGLRLPPPASVPRRVVLPKVVLPPPPPPLTPQVRPPAPLMAQPLPPPPVVAMCRPPVFLPNGGLHLAQSNMDEIVVGRWETGRRRYHFTWEKLWNRGIARADQVEALAHGKLGVWTGGVSDCRVVCAAYYNQNTCQQFWFQHVQGGLFTAILESIKADLADCPDVSQRYAVIAAGNDAGPDEIATQLVGIGFQTQNVKIYVTGTSTRGFAFGVNFVDGLLGEVTHGGAELPHDPDQMIIL